MDKHRSDYRLFKKGSKKNKTMSFDIFDKYGLENCQIELIECVNANSKDELHSRERYYIKLNKCVNKCIPLRTKEEYYDTNKEIIKEKHKI